SECLGLLPDFASAAFGLDGDRRGTDRLVLEAVGYGCRLFRLCWLHRTYLMGHDLLINSFRLHFRMDRRCFLNYYSICLLPEKPLFSSSVSGHLFYLVVCPGPARN